MPEKTLEQKMLESKVWAVIGASDNPDKFGNKTYRMLKDKGYTVYPVNPVKENICGDKCYRSISSLPQKPDVLNMVVAPEIGLSVIEEAAALGVKNIWLQPGTYNQELLNLIGEKGLNHVLNCVLVCLG